MSYRYPSALRSFAGRRLKHRLVVIDGVNHWLPPFLYWNGQPHRRAFVVEFPGRKRREISVNANRTVAQALRAARAWVASHLESGGMPKRKTGYRVKHTKPNPITGLIGISVGVRLATGRRNYYFYRVSKFGAPGQTRVLNIGIGTEEMIRAEPQRLTRALRTALAFRLWVCDLRAADDFEGLARVRPTTDMPQKYINKARRAKINPPTLEDLPT